jgi:hypothetical protein
MPAKPALQKQTSGLRDFIVENLRTMSRGRAFVIPCRGRFPQDATEYTDGEFDSLDNLRVLLEVWGSVDDPVGGRGSLGFVLVPARSVAPPALFVVRRSGRDFLSQAQQGAVLEMFAPIAIGIHDYQNRKFEDAVPNLCEGINKLQDSVNSSRLANDLAALEEQNKLLIAVRRVVSDAIRQARSDSRSRYQLVSPGSDGQFPCPFAGGAR